MRSNKLVLVAIALFSSNFAFASELLSGENVAEIKPQLSTMTFEKGQPALDLGKVRTKNYEIHCKLNEPQAEKAKINIEGSVLSKIEIVSHFDYTREINFAVSSGKGESPLSLNCEYDPPKGVKLSDLTPLTLDDMQEYFNHIRYMREQLSMTMMKMLKCDSSSAMLFKHSVTHDTKDCGATLLMNENTKSSSVLVEDTAQEICLSKLPKAEKITDRILKRCSADDNTSQLLKAAVSTR